MMISDALFAQQAIHGFTRQDRDIAALQGQLSSGLNDPRVSANVSRAMDLSALRDLRSDLATQTQIGRNAADRLSLTDSALAEITDGVRELYSISLQAANDTLTREAYGALRVQAETLRNTLLAASNATDPQGRPLFSGTAPGPAFAQTAQGIAYQGDTSATVIQLGPHARMETGLSGSRVLGDGAEGVFALLDDLITGLSEPVLSARGVLQATGRGQLDLAQQDGQEISLTLTGPLGQTEIDLTLGTANLVDQIASINAVSDQTGIQAQAATDGSGILLTAGGPFTIRNQTNADGTLATRPLVKLTALNETNQPVGPIMALRPAHLDSQRLIGRTSGALEHMAEMRAAAGALGAALESRLERIAETGLTLDQAVSRLQDVNVAEAITNLQTLLMNQQAAQQSFVKIAGRSLFDYLR
jgi:flagellar hook-associated protein 3 FlgL